MPGDLRERCAKIQLIISDVDGVLTDGSVYLGEEGTEMKRFCIADGAGAALARSAGIRIAWLSGRHSLTTANRAKELGIKDVFNGCLNKLKPYVTLLKKYNLQEDAVAYLGDDLVDISVMERVGLPIAVRNAYEPVKAVAVYTTDARGGEGAFREAVDWILRQRGDYTEVVAKLKAELLERVRDG